MLTLAIDTAAIYCSVCLWDGESQCALAAEERDIGRGHAEQLMDAIAAIMRASGKGHADVGRVAVSVGPGSFTGIRVGVAAARGFGLALGVPVVGVTTLEALAADATAEMPGKPVTVAIRGGRSQIFRQIFAADGAPLSVPHIVPEQDAARDLPAMEMAVAGNAGRDVAAALNRDVEICCDRPTARIATFARLAAGSTREPVPLYLRGADAKPQHGFAIPHAEAAPDEASA